MLRGTQAFVKDNGKGWRAGKRIGRRKEKGRKERRNEGRRDEEKE